MADGVIYLRKFGGEVPVSPPHMLPEWAAQEARFCDFTHGHLMPMKQGYLLTTMSAAVKTIYTEDGINFYTWPTETYAYKSPVMRDTFGRVYFLDAGVLKVTTAAGAAPTGGQPPSSWKAGVPAPTVKPALAVVDLNEYPDYPGGSFEAKTWWEYNSERFQEATPALAAITNLRKWQIDIPALDPDLTPAEATAHCSLTIKDGAGKAVATIVVSSGQQDARSLALPGGVTASLLKQSGTTYHLELTYGVVETRAYLYTTYNDWLEESAPSPAETIAVTYVQKVQVTMTSVDFTGFRPMLQYRLYRTMGTSASYLRVLESSGPVGGAATFVEMDTSWKASQIKGALETFDYSTTVPAMDAFVPLPGGIFAGFKGNEVYLCEPYRPHTWQHLFNFSKNVRGIKPGAQSLVVATAEACYALVGSHPKTMQPVEIQLPQAGVSQRSMVKLEGRVIFASNDGMAAVAGTAGSMASSQQLFARDDWQARYGDVLINELQFAHHDGALIATCKATARGFVVRLDEMAAGQYTRFDEQMDAMFQLPVADTLYYSKGADVFQFNAGLPYAYTWHSRDFTFARPRNLGAIYIRCAGTVTIKLYADGTLFDTRVVTQSGYYTMKAGKKALRWSVRLEGSAVVEELHIARTMLELQNV